MTLEHHRREPAPGVFRLVLPLPFPGLSRVNAYLVHDPGGATLVDCGIFDPNLGADGSWGALLGSLAACEAEPADITRLIVTHPHIDHYGLAARMVRETGCELWMHRDCEEDLEVYRDPQGFVRSLRELFEDHGVDAADLDELAVFEDLRPFISGLVDPAAVLEGGESVTIGMRSWRALHTPGHSRSHLCLISDDGVLISGDLLLPSITPHIDFRRGGREDPLGEFLESLALIERIAPGLVLPGHGRPFHDGAERARATARHHDRRLGSIVQVIRRGPRTASEITDEVFGATLLSYQRRLALGEALAHLAYLRVRGEVERVRGEDGTFRYRKVEREQR